MQHLLFGGRDLAEAERVAAEGNRKAEPPKAKEDPPQQMSLF